jgi:methionyl-tRNA formyltransferase
VCVIEVVERMDAGDVLASRRTTTAGKTAGELLVELAEAGAACCSRSSTRWRAATCAAFRRTRPRSRARASWCPTTGRIRWEHSGEEVDRRVRATTPRPAPSRSCPTACAWGSSPGSRRCASAGHLPGEVLDRDDGLVVACGKDAYRILRLQREGRRPLDVTDYLRGTPLPPGSRLGP